MSSDLLPPTIDPVAAARWHQAAPPLSPWLHEEIARRMDERLEWIVQAPKNWCHWEPVRGGLQAHGLLAARYPQAGVQVHEGAPRRMAVAQEQLGKRWWQPARWLGGAVQFGPPAPASVDMLWANMALHTAADPQGLIAQWHQALAVDGYVMFSCLGPDTLRELHAVYADLGWPVPGHAFTDMHDWGDMLVQAGFAEPVMDMERIELTYATAARLLLELREIGRNLQPARFPALRGKGWRQKLEAALTERLADAAQQGRLSMTFELIYGHAFKPKPKLRVDAQSAISLRDMREMLTRGKPGGI